MHNPIINHSHHKLPGSIVHRIHRCKTPAQNLSTAINRISDLLFHEKKYTRSHTSLSQKHYTNSPQNTAQNKKNRITHRIPSRIFLFHFWLFQSSHSKSLCFCCCLLCYRRHGLLGDGERERERERETHTNSHASRKRSANCQKIIALHALLSSLVVRRSFFFSVAVVFASMNIVILLLTHCFCFCCSSAEFSSVHRAIFFLVTSFFFCSSADTTKVVKFSAAAKCGFLIVSLNCRTARLGCSAVR